MTYGSLLNLVVVVLVLLIILAVFIGGLIWRNGRKGNAADVTPVVVDPVPSGDAGARNVNLYGSAVDQRFHYIEPTYPIVEPITDFASIDAESERILAGLASTYKVDPDTGRPVRR